MSPSFTLVGNAQNESSLARVLEGEGFRTETTGWEAAFARAERWALVVLPCEDIAGWQPVSSALTDIFAGCQRLVQEHSPNSITFLIPAAAAMGDPADAAGSALAGGLLSLSRTWAIELRKVGIPVNCVMVGEDLAGCSRLLATLAAQPDCAITGQEIFASNGSDVGRLRP